MTGISLELSELPLELLLCPSVRRRLHLRGRRREARFLWGDRPALLPVRHEGQTRLVRWGCRRRDGRRLPATGWAWQATLESGGWAPFEPEPVVIPATFCLDNGVWFGVRQGVCGLLVQDEQGEGVVYVLCEPASRYYQVMTRSERMPVLVGERI